jgi:uncharacterized protein (DUF1015 family)
VQILPSGAQPATALVLAPFRGLRYAQDRVSGLAEVTSPPYDVIAHDTADHLLASDPHNVVRLILPRLMASNTGAALAEAAGPATGGGGRGARGRDKQSAGAGQAERGGGTSRPGRDNQTGANGPGAAWTGTGYDDAARLLRAWQDERILVPDPEPALYVYEQSRAGRGAGVGPEGGTSRAGAGPEGGTSRAGAGGPVLQRGLIGALRLAPLGAGPVLPHEDVIPGPVIGRRQLMEATGANLEPIFLLYHGNGQGGAATIVGDVATRREPLLSVDTDDLIRHRLWAVTDPAEQAAIAADLASHQALIADGHHRYAAYLQLQARKRTAGAGAGPWDAGLALLVDSAAFPPHIGAIHRVISGESPAAAARRAEKAFTVRALGGLSPREALDVLRQAGREHMAFVVAGGGEFWLLTDPDPVAVADAMPGKSARWRGLSAAVMQELLLGRLWGIRDDEEHVQVHHDALAALHAAGGPSGGTAVLCPPLSTEDVREVAAHGERVPRKSTSFAPKPRSGLVLRSFALG